MLANDRILNHRIPSFDVYDKVGFDEPKRISFVVVIVCSFKNITELQSQKTENYDQGVAQKLLDFDQWNPYQEQVQLNILKGQ